MRPPLFRTLAFLCLGGASSLTAQISSIEDLQQFLVTQAPAVTAPPAVQTGPKISTNPNIFYSNPGPWGNLRCTYIYLEAPKSLIDSFPLPNTQPRWAFPEALRDSLPAFFQGAGLSAAMVTDLMDPKTMVVADGMLYLFPKPPDLEAIPSVNRAVIYTELAKYPANEFHVDPVLIIGQTVPEWYRTSKLRPEIIQKVERLSYKRGETTAFSDIGLLLSYAQSDSEARTIFKAMTRTRGLLVKIEADRGTNIEELVNYWTLGLGLRRKDVEPLLQSIIDTDGMEALPLSHMLPALVRKLIYTYPSLDMGKHGILPDCHWTSLNFFNYDPHEYLLDSRLATSAVLEKFEPIEPPYKYGDILFFLSKQTGDAYHSCVYLADNLVFTKNGRNLLSPWLVMKQEDVEKIYLYRGDGRVQGFRMKPPAAK
ncbi:hypothetical protein [Brevifollis gellanilyticus]|uniref:NlpC/P60 domain-containing protein n=1 Tax=Brevifollis gellanilyticus TaxID=748831 RepID=A0A512M7V9_9BACT|nr:hypothetical protein [Brevifollis gellanilyticus]GEP42813.1 hypothetical protein BGE01nite_21040 [Brevifollis gellanilyticus]